MEHHIVLLAAFCAVCCIDYGSARDIANNTEEVVVSGGVVDRNCSLNTDGRTMSCYTCMGRDLENCLHGLTCCKGSCFKLVDDEHEMIVKGCTNADEEDASMKVRTLNMGLYWVNDEKVKGQSYFCKGSDFCNSTPELSLLSSLASALVLRLIM